MRFTIFQKSVLVLLLLSLIISFLFFIPYRDSEHSSIIFKSITYSKGKIEFVRFLIQTFLIILVGVFLLFIVSTLNNITWQSDKSKRVVKRELKYVGIFFLSIIVLCSSLYYFNYYQTKKILKLKVNVFKLSYSKNDHIDSLRKYDEDKNEFIRDILSIINYSRNIEAINFNKIIVGSKVNKLDKSKFTSATTIDVFSEDIIPESYFENIVDISKKSDQMMLLSNLIRESRFKTVERNIKKFNPFLSKVADLDKELNIYSNTQYNKKLLTYKNLYSRPDKLKEKINSLYTDTEDERNEIKILSSRISRLQNELNSTFTIDSGQIDNLYIIIILTLFVLLFVLRYTIYAVYSLNNYLK